MEAYKSEHWTCGGTGLTNFGPEQFELYEEAVRRFGNPLFVVSSLRMDGRGSQLPGGSLHYKGKIYGSKETTVSDFWKVYEEVEKEMSRSTTAL